MHRGAPINDPEQLAGWLEQNISMLSSDNGEAMRIRRQMIVHSRDNTTTAAGRALLKDFLLKKHPREDEQSLEYRIGIYCAVTTPIFESAVYSVSRIFQQSSYSYSASENTKSFLKESLFGSGVPFDTFMEEHVLQTMLEDPNAWLVALPLLDDAPTEANRSVDVTLQVITSDYQKYQSRELILFYDPAPEFRETHFFSYKGNGKRHSSRLWAMTYTGVYRLDEARRSDGGAYWRVTGYFEHGANTLPYKVLGGKPTGEHGVYDSFFSGFVSYANAAARKFSDAQIVGNHNAFPIKQIRELACPDCQSGVQYYHGEDGKIMDGECGTCNATGRIYPDTSDPFAQIALKKPSPRIDPNTNEPVPHDDRPVVEYIAPPIEALKYLTEDVEYYLGKARQALHLDFVEEAQSGVAKALDREELYAFLSRLSNNLFGNLMKSALWFVEAFREQNGAQEPQVRQPRDFKIKSESDYRAELAEVSQLEGFPEARRSAYRKLAQAQNATSPRDAKFAEIIEMYDPYLGRTQAETDQAYRDFVMSDRERIIHDKAPALLDKVIYQREQVMEDYGWFNRTAFIEREGRGARSAMARAGAAAETMAGEARYVDIKTALDAEVNELLREMQERKAAQRQEEIDEQVEIDARLQQTAPIINPPNLSNNGTS